MRNFHRLVIASLLISFAIPTLGGCARWRKMRSLRVEGHATPAADFMPIKGEAVTADRFTAVDIENLNGSVSVRVSDRVDKASVYARARWFGGYNQDEWEEVRNEDWVVAEHVIENGNSILRVLSQATPDVTPPVRTEIQVILPRCDGVFIRNAGGDVTVIGAGGAHTIESGFDYGRGGHIEVRTSRDINDPINLRTSDGYIDLVLGPNSAGTLDIQTDSGLVSFGSKFGKTTNVRVEPLRWTGVWNDSSNPITLRTLNGNARVRVVDRPERYSTGLHWR